MNALFTVPGANAAYLAGIAVRIAADKPDSSPISTATGGLKGAPNAMKPRAHVDQTH
jgi:hypothetical protein